MSRRDDVIAEIARRHGVCLPPDDPVLHIDTMLELSEARIEAREAEREARMEALAERLESAGSAAQFTEEQVNQLGGHLAMTVSGWAPRLTKAVERRTIGILAAAGVAILLLGMGIVYWGIDGGWRGMKCGYSQTGQWMCWAPAPSGKP